MYGSVGLVKVGYNFLFTLTMKNFFVLNLWSSLPVLHVTIFNFDCRIFIHWKFLSHVSSLGQQGDLTVKLQMTVCGSGRIIGIVPLICMNLYHCTINLLQKASLWIRPLIGREICTPIIPTLHVRKTSITIATELEKYTRLQSWMTRPEDFEGGWTVYHG